MQIFKKIFVFSFVLALTSGLFHLSVAEEFKAQPEYALIFEGSPVAAHPLVPPATADAVENVPGFRGLNQIVIFRVEKILQDRLKKSNAESRSLLKGLKEKIQESLFSNTYYDPRSKPEELRDVRFSIAVRNATEAFGIADPENLPASSWRLYFKRYKQEATTFILARSEVL